MGHSTSTRFIGRSRKTEGSTVEEPEGSRRDFTGGSVFRKGYESRYLVRTSRSIIELKKGLS